MVWGVSVVAGLFLMVGELLGGEGFLVVKVRQEARQVMLGV